MTVREPPHAPRSQRVRDAHDVFAARNLVREAAQAAGFSSRIIQELVIAASELAANLAKHGGGGVLSVVVADGCLTVRAEDQGPPFLDFGATIQASSVDDQPLPLPLDRRERGVGLGRGLGAVKRFSDRLWLEVAGDRKTVAFARRLPSVRS